MFLGFRNPDSLTWGDLLGLSVVCFPRVGDVRNVFIEVYPIVAPQLHLKLSCKNGAGRFPQ